MSVVLDTTKVPVARRRQLLQDFARPKEIRARDDAELAVRAVTGSVGPIGVSLADATAHELRSEAPSVEGYSLYFMLDGRRIVTQDGRSAKVSAGDFVIGDESRPYSELSEGHFRVTSWSIHPSLLAISPQRIAEITAIAIPARRGPAWLLAPLFSRMATLLERDEMSSDLYRLGEGALVMVKALFESLLPDPAPGTPSKRTLLLRVRTYIESNLGDADLSAEQIALANHLSRRSLYRLFEEQGTSVAREIRNTRLERARQQLADPEYLHESVSEIGARWGMHDLTHFGRTFRDSYGMSPRDYRRANLAVLST